VHLVLLPLLGLGSLARLRSLRLSLLGQQDGLDVGQDASLRDRDSAQQLVELLVVTDSQLQVTWDDAGLLVVARSIAGQLKDLSAQILQDCRQIDGSSGAHTLRIVPLLEQAVHATHWKLQSSAAGA